MTTESKTLLENIAAGDNEAFKTLFDMFFPKVKVFLVKFLKDDKAAEDIAQDIFVKFHQRRVYFSFLLASSMRASMARR